MRISDWSSDVCSSDLTGPPRTRLHPKLNRRSRMIIGTFRRQDDGYAGHIRTLAFDAEINIARAQLSETENAPTWRVYLGDAEAGIEIGAGWTRCGSRGIYLALQIDDRSEEHTSELQSLMRN